MEENVNLEQANEESLQQEQLPLKENVVVKPESSLKAIIKSISQLSQSDRLTLYGRLEKLAYHDRDRFSGGLDSDAILFEQTIASLE